MSVKKQNPLAGMASTMTDGMDMMRRMWGMTGLPQIQQFPQFPNAAGIAQFAQGLPQALPSMITPTLDIGELDKRIADLRAVEQWLNLNATMLRTTIQTLEVQRNTIATLKSFGGNLFAGMNARGGGAEPAAAAIPADAQDADWPPQRLRHEQPQAVQPAPTPAATPRPAPKARRARPSRSAKAAQAAASAMPVNAAAWWGALQDQFARVAAAAVTPPQSGAKPTTNEAAAYKEAVSKAAASNAAARKTGAGKSAAKSAAKSDSKARRRKADPAAG
jgi:hypothetical protein